VSPDVRIERAGFARTGGLALITVLLLVALLVVVATAVTAVIRSHLRLADGATVAAASETLADSAIRLTFLRILKPATDHGDFGFSTCWPMQLFDRDVVVHIEREAGRLDLNNGDAALLAAVFAASGVDTQMSGSFASRILDWRDKDDEPRDEGAELAQYATAKIGYGPRNGAFESIGELRQVLGLADLEAVVLDAFTVYSTGSPTIRREFAHPLVVRALELRSGQSEQRPQAAERLDTSGPAATAHSLIGHVIRVRACADIPQLCRVAIVRLTDSPQKPFLIYGWYTDHTERSACT
jgi:general secretion pathway protein K